MMKRQVQDLDVESAVQRILGQRLLNEAALAERWDVSMKLLQKWRQTGEGPAYLKFGALVRYALTDIHDFEEKARRLPDSPSCTAPGRRLSSRSQA